MDTVCLSVYAVYDVNVHGPLIERVIRNQIYHLNPRHTHASRLLLSFPPVALLPHISLSLYLLYLTSLLHPLYHSHTHHNARSTSQTSISTQEVT